MMGAYHKSNLLIQYDQVVLFMPFAVGEAPPGVVKSLPCFCNCDSIQSYIPTFYIQIL